MSEEIQSTGRVHTIGGKKFVELFSKSWFGESSQLITVMFCVEDQLSISKPNEFFPIDVKTFVKIDPDTKGRKALNELEKK